MKKNPVIARSVLCDEAIPNKVWRLLRAKFHRLRNDRIFLIFLSLLLSSCSTSTPQTTPQVVTVYSTAAATPWLSDVYSCAESFAVISRVDDPFAADILLRVGEPKYLSSFAYQIDKEDIVIVMNNARPPIVNLQQAKKMFVGQIINLNQITEEWGEVHTGQSGDVHVWIYAHDTDIQQVFDKLFLEGKLVVSSANIAVTPQAMLLAVSNDRSAVGILTERWNSNNEVFEQAVVATVPVLAITQNEPQGAVNQIIGCLQ